MSNLQSNDRAMQAAKILEAPALYKVCEGCSSIVTARVVYAQVAMPISLMELKIG